MEMPYCLDIMTSLVKSCRLQQLTARLSYTQSQKCSAKETLRASLATQNVKGPAYLFLLLFKSHSVEMAHHDEKQYLPI